MRTDIQGRVVSSGHNAEQSGKSQRTLCRNIAPPTDFKFMHITQMPKFGSMKGNIWRKAELSHLLSAENYSSVFVSLQRLNVEIKNTFRDECLSIVNSVTVTCIRIFKSWKHSHDTKDLFEPVPVAHIIWIGDGRMREQDVRILCIKGRVSEIWDVSIKPEPMYENFKLSRRKCA
jgi:hypothetical protein